MHRSRCLAVSFVLGLAQVTAALVDGPIDRTLPGFYDLAIIIAIYSAVAYGARATRLFAVAGGIGGAVLASLSDGAEAAIEQQNIGEARKAVAAIGRTGRDALTDVRLLLGMLRSDRGLAEPQPGIDQLEDLIGSVPLKVRLDVDGPPRELPLTVIDGLAADLATGR